MTWELSTAARTAWQEVRGEPLEGQRAFTHVLVNRQRDGRWGKSLAAICLARSQFSAWGPVDPSSVQMVQNFRASCALKDDDAVLVGFEKLIQAALDGEPDPTLGATHYYADSIPSPPWAKTGTFCCQIGHHRFYKNVR